MSTIAAAVFDVVAALHGRGCSMGKVIKALPAIDPESVINAAHRLSIAGALILHRNGKTIVYCAKPGAQPTDGRGRPARIAVAPRSGTSG